jgi:hypothetical protein
MPGRRRFAGLGLGVVLALLVSLPAGAVSAPQPRFSCPWSASVAALCLAYDAQALAAAYGDASPTARGMLATVVPATPAGGWQPSYGVAPRVPAAPRPAFAIVLRGDFAATPGGTAAVGWLVAFVDRATGRLRLVLGPGIQHFGDVIPAGASFRALPAPPRWAADCAVTALQRSRIEYVMPLLHARSHVRSAPSAVARRRALAALRRLQAQVGPRADEIASQIC